MTDSPPVSITVSLIITYILDHEDTPVFQRTAHFTLDGTPTTLTALAKEAGVSLDQYLLQWVSREYVSTMSLSTKDKDALAAVLKQYKNKRVRIEVTLDGKTTWLVKWLTGSKQRTDTGKIAG